MAFYVRKIARAKWSLLDPSSPDTIENYRADTIANDLRTTNDTLSFWKSESLDQDALEPIIVINSLLGSNIRTINLLCVPDTLMTEFDLKQEDGDTILHEYCGLHHNVISLSVGRLIDFASCVVLKTLASASTEQSLVKQIRAQDQLKTLIEWLDSGKLDYDELNEGQQKDIDRYREKLKKLDVRV